MFQRSIINTFGTLQFFSFIKLVKLGKKTQNSRNLPIPFSTSHSQSTFPYICLQENPSTCSLINFFVLFLFCLLMFSCAVISRVLTFNRPLVAISLSRWRDRLQQHTNDESDSIYGNSTVKDTLSALAVVEITLLSQTSYTPIPPPPHHSLPMHP